MRSRSQWQSRGVTTIKINAITVPAGSGDELAHEFAAPGGAVGGADGFEGFELLRPSDDREQWLVVTRWRDEESFQAWVSSPEFADGHRSAVESAGGEAPPTGVDTQRGMQLRSGRRLDPDAMLTIRPPLRKAAGAEPVRLVGRQLERAGPGCDGAVCLNVPRWWGEAVGSGGPYLGS